MGCDRQTKEKPVPIQLKPLHEQRIVITGATSGIGLATAEAAATAGARVLLTARNGDALARIDADLRARGGNVVVLPLDTADPDYAETLAATAVDRFGGFDTWVNNAAAATFGTLAQTPIEDQRRVFEVGYWGTVNGALMALKHLRDAGHSGAIINLGSVLSERAMILQGAYSAMKHAVKGFTDTLRTEIMRDRLPIAVTLIKPSAMHTPYADHARNYMSETAQLPPPLYDPRLVARAILFAAAHPRRELTVGGFGAAGAVGDLMFPGLMDRAMAAFGTATQQTDAVRPSSARDNLHQPRADGEIDGSQKRFVRRHSLWLEAQMRPAAALGAAALGAGAIGLAVAGMRRKS
jgi:NAD(P)-dependent dehydrogenase (short-subunit alcohol dehydrogenase family)